MSNAATPAHGGAASHIPPQGPVSRIESKPEAARSLADAKADAVDPEESKYTAAGIASTATAAAGGAAAAVKNAVPTSTDEAKTQLENANAKIAQLTEQLKDQTGLRQRKGFSDDKSSVGGGSLATQQQHTPSGVPVPIVAALCLISFLLAYLLF